MIKYILIAILVGYDEMPPTPVAAVPDKNSCLYIASQLNTHQDNKNTVEYICFPVTEV